MTDLPNAATPAGPWQKSSYSGSGGNGSCVEVRPPADGGVLLRDTKDRSIAPFRYTAEEWSAFIAGAKAGEFDTGTFNDMT